MMSTDCALRAKIDHFWVHSSLPSTGARRRLRHVEALRDAAERRQPSLRNALSRLQSREDLAVAVLPGEHQLRGMCSHAATYGMDSFMNRLPAMSTMIEPVELRSER
jgi:hypothetical protein